MKVFLNLCSWAIPDSPLFLSEFSPSKMPSLLLLDYVSPCCLVAQLCLTFYDPRGLYPLSGDSTPRYTWYRASGSRMRNGLGDAGWSRRSGRPCSEWMRSGEALPSVKASGVEKSRYASRAASGRCKWWNRLLMREGQRWWSPHKNATWLPLKWLAGWQCHWLNQGNKDFSSLFIGLVEKVYIGRSWCWIPVIDLFFFKLKMLVLFYF